MDNEKKEWKKMEDKIKTGLLAGILLCLVVIALKPVPSINLPDFPTSPPSVEIADVAGESVVQLGQNRIAIIDTRSNSGTRGNIKVLEYDEQRKTFREVSNYNYTLEMKVK
jgi:hypothetical protein